VDRPQRSSSLPPALYGLIPQTLCGPGVGKLTPGADGGDGDPLDVCVVCESPIRRAEVVLEANVVGGLQTIDGGKADDKIIAVFFNDMYWRDVDDVSNLPPSLIERLRHYFATYKLIPGRPPTVTVEGVYGRNHALQVVEAAMADYQERFGSSHEKG
jgi:inorganic pyrophosphatase